MNIPVLTYEGSVIVRPGTSWERYNRDLYVPDFVSRISGSPVLAASICKPGRSVSGKFARRYYDHAGLGVLLYADDLIDGSAEGYAEACCVDHMTFVPFPETDLSGLFDLDVSMSAGGTGCGSFRLDGALSVIDSAMERISSRCLVRTGDIIAVELTPRVPLCRRGGGCTRVTVSSSPRLSEVDFQILF